jgi:site-specific DNA-methyltransferase (cytosine-N4-specific)
LNSSLEGLPGNLAELRLKEYIQPFERALARAELTGLLPRAYGSDPFGPIPSTTVRVAGDCVPSLIARLAYWEEIIYDGRHTTHQVVLERTASGKSTRQYRNLRYGSHDIHEYRGKFFPQLVRALLNYARLPEGALVLDPMSGSGTTNCEVRLLGMRAIGMDLNPLSVLIAKTKCDLLTADPAELQADATRILRSLRTERTAGVIRNIPWTSEDRAYLSRWFDAEALVDVAMILSAIGVEQTTSSAFLRLSLSNVLRRVSWQKNDDLRVRKEIVPYPRGLALDLFGERVEGQLKKLIPFLHAVREGHGATTMHAADVREGDSRIIGDTLSQYAGMCDALITSPPYATALPYLDTDRLSLIALGLLPRADHRTRDTLMIGNREVTEAQRRALWASYMERKADLPPSVQELVDGLGRSYHHDSVGFRRRNLPALIAKYFLDMTAVLQSSLSLMRKGAPAFFVVGSNSTRVDGVLLTIQTEQLLQDVAMRLGWRFDRKLSMELLPSRDIFRENRGTAETLLSFTAGPTRAALFHIDVSSSRREQKRDAPAARLARCSVFTATTEQVDASSSSSGADEAAKIGACVTAKSAFVPETSTPNGKVNAHQPSVNGKCLCTARSVTTNAVTRGGRLYGDRASKFLNPIHGNLRLK